jgi:DNA repair photolyase
VHNLRILGGLREHLRFFHLVDPAITRKRTIFGQAVKSQAALDVVEIEPLGVSMPMYDITTGTGDFIANGVISHNCYARPAHSYMNLSPGLDFETKLFYKENAAELLEKELREPRYVCKPINLGANTDPYQPIERTLKVTRSILEVLQRHRHPVTIVTKGHLVERDIDILAAMARDNLAAVHVSVTTLDSDLKRTLEPRAPSPAARLHAIRALREAGVPVGALVAPVIPAINDHEIEHILAAIEAAGARTAGYVMLRLPYEVKDLFREWLAVHYPLRAAHVMSLVRDLRGGRDNDPNFGSRMRGTGTFAELVRRRFDVACRKLNLNAVRYPKLDTSLFQPPTPPGAQLGLGF